MTTELTEAERQMATSFGMTPQEYAAAKDPGYQPPPVVSASDRAAAAEHERIKRAVAAALAERDRDAA